MNPDGSLGIEPHVWFDPKGAKGNGEWVAVREIKPCVVKHVRVPTEEEAIEALEAMAKPEEPVNPQETCQTMAARFAEQMAKSARSAVEGGP